MKIIEINIMRGPNYWSVKRQKLIVMKLDLEALEYMPTDKISGFSERIEGMFPSMYHHYCSEGRPGGFFFRVKEGTWMGHVIEHIALEIQTLSGIDCGFGRTRGTGQEGIYHVVFEYQQEAAGLYAAQAAVSIAQAIIEGKDYDLEADLQMMREIKEKEQLGPSTSAIVAEAIKRDIPYLRLNNDSLVMLGQGIHQKIIDGTITCNTSAIAVDIACNKKETKALLAKAAIPVPEGEVVKDETELDAAIDQLDYPLVIKPVDGNHGRGATINISSKEEAQQAFQTARRISDTVIVERYVKGADFRLLVIDGKLVAAAKRTPAAITGDGKSTIQQLIDMINKDPSRGNGHENVLTRITVDEMSLAILKEKGLTLQSVLKDQETVLLKHTANLSTRGTATDVTDLLHPANILLSERIARITRLDICGIDVVAADLSTPIIENGGAVLEVNAAPGFRMHLAPTEGLPRNVAKAVIDMLFPPGAKARIPVVAVTGTNGKTTTTRLIAHMTKLAGHHVGFTTTDGIYIQDHMIEKGDCTGPLSAQAVLTDPTVDFAVLECARGGMLRSGLGFAQCDIGIVTNVSEDHLGLKGIHTLEQLARVKAIVPESVSHSGYAILNADDDLVYEMHKSIKSKVAYFSLDEDNPRIKAHCQTGGLAAVVENGYITICQGRQKVCVDKVNNIPLTFGGKAVFMVQNILPAVLAGYISHFKVENLQAALQSFIPSPDLTPGRMNFFHLSNCQVLIDYAHNPAGFKAIGKFLESIRDRPKIGIIAGVGDRRDEDIIHLGKLAAAMFDELIIRLDQDLRGRTDREMVDLITHGIYQTDSQKPVAVIPDEKEAICYAIQQAAKNAFIVVTTEMVDDAIATVKRCQQEEEIHRQNSHPVDIMNNDKALLEQ